MFIMAHAVIAANDNKRSSSGGTATSSTKGMWGKDLPHGGEDRSRMGGKK